MGFDHSTRSVWTWFTTNTELTARVDTTYLKKRVLDNDRPNNPSSDEIKTCDMFSLRPLRLLIPGISKTPDRAFAFPRTKSELKQNTILSEATQKNSFAATIKNFKGNKGKVFVRVAKLIDRRS